MHTEYPWALAGVGGITASPNIMLAFASSSNLHASVSVDAIAGAASAVGRNGRDAWGIMAPGFSVSRLHANAASIRAEKRRLIFIFTFTLFRFSNTIVFYIKESLAVLP